MAANIPIRSRHTGPSNSRSSTNNSISVPSGQPTSGSTSRANTPSPLEDDVMSGANLRGILQLIATSVSMLAKDNGRSTYVNKLSPFADTPLIFNRENVTSFLKEVERRSAFYH
ncbi:hypothetical protein BDW02DRAFT_598231 [Decorospora gaudefroyi]|uniref:Uncharacterized protein n=1 Tax=Decorospora gaudefroyi TaxID=184978 RepID=A0A6A5KFJ7_9PLEO|nr:hypothetical protein BDW02DRAFT_598231 [Decorospora gaudefroyi]